MRQYLSTLHQKPAHHKKRFAFLVSAGMTLAIFTVWSLVTFGTGGTLAQDKQQLTTNDQQLEVGPLESFKESLAATWEGVKESFDGLSGGIQGAVDLESDYTEMRDNVLNIYGQ